MTAKEQTEIQCHDCKSLMIVVGSTFALPPGWVKFVPFQPGVLQIPKPEYKLRCPLCVAKMEWK